ncbi:glutathione S-transferase family protein [Microvirga alba]|uniref:Glutathione S-transferase family protein n=1 Tax=Microvirga alba TaxID=2791025 RepID=A0A931FPE6_9HYPH|nr:glutathione S-transferase family protein [Microvirga alba]MBF9232343.1 glutathione S-transferase family protein [Microvirga alba]
MSARFELHGTFLSGPTYKVGLMLSLAGEPFDYVHVNLREGEHKQPDYVSKQRYGQVPLLIDKSNGRQLCQSAAILEYLADKIGKFGGATLDERLEVREWLYWDFDRLAPPIYRTRAIKAGYRKGGPEILEMCAAEGALALATLDRHLAGKNWIVGEGVTIADIDIYGVLAYAAEGGFDLSGYVNVTAWMKRMEAQAGFGAQPGLLPSASREAA